MLFHYLSCSFLNFFSFLAILIIWTTRNNKIKTFFAVIETPKLDKFNGAATLGIMTSSTMTLAITKNARVSITTLHTYVGVN